MPSPITSIALALAFVKAVVATPKTEVTTVVARDWPEVVPGPGLPSLESLNLTSAELYEMKPTSGLNIDAALFTLECGPDDGAYAEVASIIACYNYLNSLGTTSCSVPGYGAPVVQMCYSGDAQVDGQSISGNDESSYCSDVAYAVLSVINGCTRPDQTCAGFNAAGGNGNLIIGSVNIDY